MRVLVTGGSRGIGRACVKKFAERGDEVAFIYRSNHDAALALAWDAPARPSTATSASARTAPCLKGRKSYGKH